jgi:hypothetical protein
LSRWLPHHLLTMDSIEMERLLADEVRLKHCDCTLMFDVAGLEGEHDILQYVKPNTLAKYLQLMMECTTNGFPKQCMMCFPEVYSGEMMWDNFKECHLQGVRGAGLHSRNYSVLQINCVNKKCCVRNSSDWLDIFAWLCP